jgi:hypothetical protein
MFMSSDTDIVDRDQQMLGELAELDLALARHVQGRALATDDATEVADLSRAYQRIARSLRQTLALKAKLKRDAEQHAGWLAARDFTRRTPAAPPPVDRAARRRAELEAAVGRVIWAEREYDGHDWEDRRERRFQYMDSLLSNYADRFSGATLDENVLKLCAELGLSRVNALNWRKLPEPEFEDDEDDEDEPRRSSG